MTGKGSAPRLIHDSQRHRRMTLRNKLIAAAFVVACIALAAGAVAFPDWARFVLQLVGVA